MFLPRDSSPQCAKLKRSVLLRPLAVAGLTNGHAASKGFRAVAGSWQYCNRCALPVHPERAASWLLRRPEFLAGEPQRVIELLVHHVASCLEELHGSVGAPLAAGPHCNCYHVNQHLRTNEDRSSTLQHRCSACMHSSAIAAPAGSSGQRYTSAVMLSMEKFELH